MFNMNDYNSTAVTNCLTNTPEFINSQLRSQNTDVECIIVQPSKQHRCRMYTFVSKKLHKGLKCAIGENIVHLSNHQAATNNFRKYYVQDLQAPQ